LPARRKENTKPKNRRSQKAKGQQNTDKSRQKEGKAGPIKKDPRIRKKIKEQRKNQEKN